MTVFVMPGCRARFTVSWSMTAQSSPACITRVYGFLYQGLEYLWSPHGFILGPVLGYGMILCCICVFVAQLGSILCFGALREGWSPYYLGSHVFFLGRRNFYSSWHDYYFSWWFHYCRWCRGHFWSHVWDIHPCRYCIGILLRWRFGFWCSLWFRGGHVEDIRDQF